MTAQRTKNESISPMAFLCGMMCAGLCLLPLPIVQIVFGLSYETAECVTNRFPFNVNTFLVIEGNVGLLTYAFVCIAMICVDVGKCLLYLLSAFNFCWLIIGGVLFWGDCKSNVGNNSVEVLLWITLIWGYLAIFASLQNKNSADK